MKNNIEPIKTNPDYSSDDSLSVFFNTKASSNFAELDFSTMDDTGVNDETDLIKLGQTFKDKDLNNLGLYPALKKTGLYTIDLSNYSADAMRQLKELLYTASFNELNGKSYYLSVADQFLYINDIQLLPVVYSFVFDTLASWAAPRVYLNKKIIHLYVEKLNNESLHKYNLITTYSWGCTVLCPTDSSFSNFKRWLKDLGYQEGNNFFAFKNGDFNEVILTDDVDCEAVKEYSAARDLIYVTI